ncbi:hypothetical protein DFH08DRAFT_1077903 [Mycena albidolilacea]|uniref:G protein-coupled receptor n=1 Tax=Mycena albidolilacea TaxID=1033008 RepID=A0AAD7A9K0_9AGAR|nr:hypothetical protein DFH08DRAFT_1077903 [Mycena albidolilacea]
MSCGIAWNLMTEATELPLTAEEQGVANITSAILHRYDVLPDSDDDFESPSASLLTNSPISTRVVLGLIIPGLVLTAALLALYAYAAWKVVSQRYLDRVSFRLLTYDLVANFVFCVSFTMATLAGYPGWQCSLSSFLTNSSLMFSAALFFCTSLNVPLVVVHNVNGQAMEKYYVAGTTLICLICTVPPYASGKLGKVPDSHRNALRQTCWYNSKVKFRWLIGAQTSWIMLFAVGDIAAFLIILGYLIAHELHLICRPANTVATYSSEGAGSAILKFRSIILRIGLYPLVSFVLNLTATVIDLHEFRKHKMGARKSTKLDKILLLVNVATCAGRPLIYGLVAATDPLFIHPGIEGLAAPRSRVHNAV